MVRYEEDWVVTAEPRHVCVGMHDREEFDAIALPVEVWGEEQRDLRKTMVVGRPDDGKPFTICFHHVSEVAESEEHLNHEYRNSKLTEDEP